MHGIEEGLLDKGCAEASDLLYLKVCFVEIVAASKYAHTKAKQKLGFLVELILRL